MPQSSKTEERQIVEKNDFESKFHLSYRRASFEQ